MNDALKKYFMLWDPMDFIEEEGAPADEYDQEADEVMRRYKKNMTSDEVADLVHTVFVEFMEIDPVDFKDDCFRRAEQLAEILSTSSSNSN